MAWSIPPLEASRGGKLPTPGAGAAGVAFAAGTGTDEGELAAFGAGVAFVALQAGQADSLIKLDGDAAFGTGGWTFVAVAVAVFGEGMQVSASRQAEFRLGLVAVFVGGRIGVFGLRGYASGVCPLTPDPSPGGRGGSIVGFGVVFFAVEGIAP
jgi:hypothetical protein